jgi:lipopolysaccharide exporter
MSLGRQIAKGALWNYAAFVASKGLLFLATLVLARLLSPADFGLVGVALLVITALDIVRDFGIGGALIYLQRGGQRAADTAFLLSSAIGAGLCAACWPLAPVAIRAFHTSSPDEATLAVALLRTLGVCLLIAGLGSTQDALLQKELDYRLRLIPQVGRTAVKGGLQVLLALLGWGVWSLVIGQVVGEAAATMLLWYVSRWRPTFALDRALLGPVLSYGGKLMLVGGLGWLVDDLDYLIIGTQLGEAALGLYTLAFRIPELTIRNLAQAVSAVAFPAAARLQDDRAALRAAYLQMQRTMLIILAPLAGGLFAIAPQLIHLLFPARWEPVIPVMQLLALYMALGGIGHWPGVIYKAVGRPGILNILALAKLALLAPALYWSATTHGIMGVAWTQLIVRLFTLLLDMVIVARFLHLSLAANLWALRASVAAATIMAVAVRAILSADPGGHNVPLLALAIAAGVLIYGGAIWLLDRPVAAVFLAVAREVVRRPAPSGL